jgi:hypothetical protein
VQNEPNDPVSGEAAVTPTSQTGDVRGSSAAPPTNGFRAFVRRRELVIFFVLSYLIAWSTLPFGAFLLLGLSCRRSSSSRSPRACRGWLGLAGASSGGG